MKSFVCSSPSELDRAFFGEPNPLSALSSLDQLSTSNDTTANRSSDGRLASLTSLCQVSDLASPLPNGGPVAAGEPLRPPDPAGQRRPGVLGRPGLHPLRAAPQAPVLRAVPGGPPPLSGLPTPVGRVAHQAGLPALRGVHHHQPGGHVLCCTPPLCTPVSVGESLPNMAGSLCQKGVAQHWWWWWC